MSRLDCREFMLMTLFAKLTTHYVMVVLLLLSGGMIPAETLAVEPVVIKFATLAPDGTPWMTVMQEMNEELKRLSQGQVAFRFYAGGVAGDEQDVIRKMQRHELHGGAFTGVGLGRMVPESRVLELPFLFQDAAEADYVAAELLPYFEAAFAKQGYTLLTFGEAGAVFLFAKQALRSLDALRQVKSWVWEGDPVAQAMFRAFGVSPVALALPDVLPALQDSRVEVCYGTSLSILAFQWFTQVRYRLASPISRAMGALLITRHQWDKLSADQQSLVRKTVRQYAVKAAQSVRQSDQKALPLLKTTGMQTTSLSAADMAELQQRSEQLRQELVGKVYTQQLLDEVKRLRADYRHRRSTSQ